MPKNNNEPNKFCDFKVFDERFNTTNFQNLSYESSIENSFFEVDADINDINHNRRKGNFPDKCFKTPQDVVVFDDSFYTNDKRNISFSNYHSSRSLQMGKRSIRNLFATTTTCRKFGKYLPPDINTFLFVILAVFVLYIYNGLTEMNTIEDIEMELMDEIVNIHEKVNNLNIRRRNLSKIVDRMLHVNQKNCEWENIRNHINYLKNSLKEAKEYRRDNQKRYIQNKLKSIQMSNSLFNAANIQLGAEIVAENSSRVVLERSNLFADALSYINFFSGSYVLLDREFLTEGESWCTEDNNPLLTIKLAHAVKPRIVSYQHWKWRESIPSTAPMIYDVLACSRQDCNDAKFIANSCQYNDYGIAGNEQICSVEGDAETMEAVRYVQIKFRRNHGHPYKICGSLIRVYGIIDD